MKFDRVYTLKEVAKLTNSEMFGDADFVITGMNEIHSVESGDLTFVDHPKYYIKALQSAATTILINEKVECPAGKALLFNKDPFGAYVSLAMHFRKFESSQASISEDAIVGEGTIIQPGSFIGRNVRIGKNCIIHSNVSIYDYTEIGNNVIVHANSVIGADAYYFQHRQEGYRKLFSCGNVMIEDNVEVGALCAIDKGVSSTTFIGKGTKMDNHVQVGHDTYIGQNCLIGAHCAIAGVTRIEDDVILWARVSVNKDLIIGKGAIILATSGIDKSLEGGKTYFGAPVAEVRKTWREMASIRQLPDIITTLNKKGII